MREIKFRAAVIETGEVFPVLTIWSESVCVDTTYGTYDWDSYVFSKEKIELLQYTGLKDKNGVEIYEGDIVKVELIDLTEIYEVYYQESKARFSFKDSDGFDWGFDKTVKKEVISSIYESKEE